MKHKLKSALAAAKKSAKRELGIFAVMLVFGAATAIIAVPVIFVIGLMPDWVFVVLFGFGFVWMIFGETINSAVSAYRGKGDQP